MKKHEDTIHKAAAKYILGENINTSIKGNKEQLLSLEKLLESSKKLYMKLNENSASLDEILKLIEQKNIHADRFYSLTGIKWNL